MIATLLYSVDTGTNEGNINSTLLRDNGYVTDELCDCPGSPEIGYDDYTITLVGGRIAWSTCLIYGADHLLGDLPPPAVPPGD
jgi:hypothetical protein